ncbi:alpha/beta hydrolase [Variovorax fucosicus]|uniref:alpha/beta hydrolase n=1 Tax=Variovorax fucosicus TaxID=3053517 RepID=UPI0025777901|nr:alpha/beta hydrolase [Variovorax sp. J22G47]MDM0058489.1 alpha/beta hydrolase [Variovorax sp. J22G47]
MAPHDDDPVWLDRMYNNRARVPGHPAYFARWAHDSAQVRAAAPPGVIDRRYGDGVNETLDIFPAASAFSAPVLVFVHGGYWRSLDKSDHSFVAPAFTAQGVCVVVPNYALCPGTAAQPVTIPDIALQMVKALAWTWHHVAEHGGDPRRITVAGHSAGGHLAAMLLACDWKALGLPAQLVRNALSVSGLYDLQPLMRTPSLQEALRLTPQDARRASPALWPAPKQGQLYSVVGGDESEEFLRHNALIRKAWGARTVPVCEELPGLNHFSVLDALADPSHALHGSALSLLQDRR